MLSLSFEAQYAGAADAMLKGVGREAFDAMKTLIAHNYYPEDEFWQTWNRPNHEAVKAITDPRNRFRGLYDKTCKAAMGATE